VFLEQVFEESERKRTQPTTTTPVPNCLSSHLSVFKFREFCGSKDELELTKYILKNSKVLKTVTIEMEKWLEPKQASQAMSKLHALLSASKFNKLSNSLSPLTLMYSISSSI